MTPTQKAIRRDRKYAAAKWSKVISRAAHKIVYRSNTHWTIWVSDSHRLEFYPPSGKVLRGGCVEVGKAFNATSLIKIIKRETELALEYETSQYDSPLVDDGDNCEF